MHNDFLKEKYGVEAIQSAEMRDYTTLRLGGPCRAMIFCGDSQAFADVARDLQAAGEPFLTIGSGSNLLVSDQGITEMVLRYVSTQPEISAVEDGIRVGAGTLLSDLCTYAIERDIDNFTYCVGIPGTVGGAVAGNAGAFGRQIGDELLSAEVLDFDGKIKMLVAEELEFAYRDSILKHSDGLLLAATFKTTPGRSEEILHQAREFMQISRDRHPDYRAVPTAGSFFRNIEPSSAAERRQAAGWFLEQSGAYEMRFGGARVFEKHANIIINDSPDCSASDVLDLATAMHQAVKDKFGIDLQREVKVIGLWGDSEDIRNR